MNTYQHVLKKYNIKIGREYVINIPNINRDNLAKLFAELKFNKGVELGVAQGLYSEVLCKANPKLHLYGVDPWLTKGYEPTIHGTSHEQEEFDIQYKETVKRMKSYNYTIVKKSSKDALKNFKDNSLDFVYIDANHDFLNFTFDLHYWRRKVRIGGIVSGHDYANFKYKKFNHVKRALDAYARCYGMIPFFIVGADSKQTKIRDTFRSWFWIKKETNPK